MKANEIQRATTAFNALSGCELTAKDANFLLACKEYLGDNGVVAFNKWSQGSPLTIKDAVLFEACLGTVRERPDPTDSAPPAPEVEEGPRGWECPCGTVNNPEVHPRFCANCGRDGHVCLFNDCIEPRLPVSSYCAKHTGLFRAHV